VDLVNQNPHVRVLRPKCVPLRGSGSPQDLEGCRTRVPDPKNIEAHTVHDLEVEDRRGPELLFMAEAAPIVADPVTLELLPRDHLRGLPQDRQHLAGAVFDLQPDLKSHGLDLVNGGEGSFPWVELQEVGTAHIEAKALPGFVEDLTSSVREKTGRQFRGDAELLPIINLCEIPADHSERGPPELSSGFPLDVVDTRVDAITQRH